MQNLELLLLALCCGILSYAGFANHIHRIEQSLKPLDNDDWIRRRNKNAKYILVILALYLICLSKILSGLSLTNNSFVSIFIWLAFFADVILIADCVVFLLAYKKPALPSFIAPQSQLLFALLNASLTVCMLLLIGI